MIDWTTVLSSMIVGVFVSGGVYGAIRIELKYLRRDTDHAHKRITDHENNFFHKRGQASGN